MTMQSVSYDHVRQHSKAGDVFAFSGSSLLSEYFKLLQKSPVSHTGIIISAATGASDHPMLVESTVDFAAGEYTVKKSPLKEVIDEYEGHVWRLPRSPNVPFEASPFTAFLEDTIGQNFDYVGGLGVILGEFLDSIAGTEVEVVPEDLSAYFCSELVAQALEEAKTIPPVNASEVSPKDLCKWAIFTEDYHFVEPDQEVPEIPDYNTIDPSSQSQELEFGSYEAVEAFQAELQAQFASTERVIPTWRHEINKLREGLDFAREHLRDAGLTREAAHLDSLLREYSTAGP